MRRYLVAALVCWLLAALTAVVAYGGERTVLGGIGTTRDLGEQSPFALVTGDVELGAVQLEGLWSDANKYTGKGWILRGAADVWFGDLSIGGGYTHRNGGPWTKRVWWGRVGVRSGPLRVLAEVAPASQNLEAKLEVRVRVCRDWFVVESRAFVEYHSQVSAGYGRGLSILVGGTW